MADEREYAVNYLVTHRVKSHVLVDLDEVRTWISESPGCTYDIESPDYASIREFLLSSREGPWDDLNYNSLDSEELGDYHSLTIVRET